MKDLVNAVNKRYTRISNRVTEAYEKTFALPCEVYYPIFPPYTDRVKYRDMKIFTPHQSPTYAKTPDLKTSFYIHFLIPKQAMNSSETEFDSFFTEDTIDRPFIETSKKRELPIATKVVVHQGASISKFFVDKKLVVTGADGMMLLRMFLSPLAKDEDGEIEEQEETKIEGEDYSPKSEEGTGLGATLGSTKKKSSKKKTDNAATMQDLESGFTMNIPDED
jgi:hypothetical protein